MLERTGLLVSWVLCIHLAGCGGPPIYSPDDGSLLPDAGVDATTDAAPDATDGSDGGDAGPACAAGETPRVEERMVARLYGYARVSILWIGDRYVIAWADQSDGIHVAHYGADGAVLVPDTLLAPSSVSFPRDVVAGRVPLGAPGLAFTGEEVLVVWTDAPEEIHGRLLFTRSAVTDGRRIGEVAMLSEASAIARSRPSLAWTGAELFVAWEDGPAYGEEEIQLARVDREGTVLDRRTATDSPGSAVWPQIVWTGDRLALLWNDDRDVPPEEDFGLEGMEVWTAMLSATGEPIGEPQQLTDGTEPAFVAPLLWTGTELLAFHETDATPPDDYGFYVTALFVTRLRPDGTIAGRARITDDGRSVSGTSAVMVGDEVRAMWLEFTRDDETPRSRHTVLARISLAGESLDQDRLTDSARAFRSRPGVIATDGCDAHALLVDSYSSHYLDDSEISFARILY